MVTVGIGQGIVADGQAELIVSRLPAINEYVLILYLADRRCLEEAEHALLAGTGHHIAHHLRAGLHRGHGLGVKLRGVRPHNSPISVYPSIVVHQHGGVKVQHALCLLWVVFAPVTGHERPVGAVCLGHHVLPSLALVVGKKVVSLFPVLAFHLHDVRGIEYISHSTLVERLPVRSGLRLKDNPLITPVIEVFHGSRPQHLLPSAILGLHRVMRAVYIQAVVSRAVRVFKHVRFPVRDVLP